MADTIKRLFPGLRDGVCNALLQVEALQPGDANLSPDQVCWHTPARFGGTVEIAQWQHLQPSDENLSILFQVVAVKSSNLYYVWRIPAIIDKHEYKAICAERPKSLSDRR
ncbi:MAG: hypothetical protein KA779_09300 [Propionivibrio sp.]|jgi:hypothetical protein|nr:hypothetical protein [Propionivibrio sp.]MBP6711615.1 hypothetical protein [Propionivibrio sp.]MBP7524943.1 hypothetical protein [Propionivibrio sp.]MBP8163541.1 hypothetical protein [Propionivibrio sp.]